MHVLILMCLVPDGVLLLGFVSNSGDISESGPLTHPRLTSLDKGSVKDGSPVCAWLYVIGSVMSHPYGDEK